MLRHPFPPNSKYHNSIRAREQNLWHNVHHPLWYRSYVTCFVSRVTWHHYSQTIRAGKLNFLDNVSHPIWVTCHVSCVTCHMSKLVGGGSVINGAIPCLVLKCIAWFHFIKFLLGAGVKKIYRYKFIFICICIIFIYIVGGSKKN